MKTQSINGEISNENMAAKASMAAGGEGNVGEMA
jgi:hypothetical protein